jgi:hypothetical protein
MVLLLKGLFPFWNGFRLLPDLFTVVPVKILAIFQFFANVLKLWPFAVLNCTTLVLFEFVIGGAGDLFWVERFRGLGIIMSAIQDDYLLRDFPLSIAILTDLIDDIFTLDHMPKHHM